jgi:eukaryotic-like serine/threonine-protein kinase
LRGTIQRVMSCTCPPDDQLLALATDEPDLDPLREHVDHCVDCQNRVKQLCGEIAELRSLSIPVTVVGVTTAPEGTTSTTLPNSTSIGRYVVIANLGTGGQGDVYRVVDPNLGRQLVLKLSHRQALSGDDRRNALLAEGRVLANLDHPGLIRVFDVGIYNGRPYLVLEHVPGRNLEQIFADKRPSPREAARLVAEIARVVVYAHRYGIAHGDITPKNILIDAQGQPRLIDFGLSQIEDAWGVRTGLAGGTPDFLPPEIAPQGGQLGRAGLAGDVFGLGATLFWLLTGLAPFAGASVADSLERSRRCEIEFDALRRAKVPSRIARVCQEAMNIDPAVRPTPQQVMDELTRASRSGLVPWVTAAVLVLLLGVGAIFTWQRDSRDSNLATATDIIHSTPVISVYRREGIRTLSNELPLKNGDHISIACNISRGHQAIMLRFNSAGELKMFTPVRDVVDSLDRLVYPTPHGSISLEPPVGTEMVFFCRGEPVDFEDLLGCFPKDQAIPVLPSHNWLTLQRQAVKIEGPLKSGVPDEIVKVEGLMKDINRKLKRFFPNVTGIAFPHVEADTAAQ